MEKQKNSLNFYFLIFMHHFLQTLELVFAKLISDCLMDDSQQNRNLFNKEDECYQTIHKSVIFSFH